MKRPRKRPLIGKWRIIEMEPWDKDYLDMVEPAYIQFKGDGLGSSSSVALPVESTATSPMTMPSSLPRP